MVFCLSEVQPKGQSTTGVAMHNEKATGGISAGVLEPTQTIREGSIAGTAVWIINRQTVRLSKEGISRTILLDYLVKVIFSDVAAVATEPHVERLINSKTAQKFTHTFT